MQILMHEHASVVEELTMSVRRCSVEVSLFKIQLLKKCLQMHCLPLLIGLFLFLVLNLK